MEIARPMALAQLVAQAAPAIALGVHHASCLLDMQSVVIDGSFGPPLRDALLGAVQAALGNLSWEGVTAPSLLAGTIGSDARALGGAWLPLHAAFAPDSEIFLKLGV